MVHSSQSITVTSIFGDSIPKATFARGWLFCFQGNLGYFYLAIHKMTENIQASYYFKVQYGKIEMSFQEVSGLDITNSNLKNGNNHSPIRFKRGLCQNWKSFQLIIDAFNNLCKIPVKNLTISLLNSDAEVIRAWQCLHAYPIKFELDTLKYTSDFLTIENLEMEYSVITRTK